MCKYQQLYILSLYLFNSERMSAPTTNHWLSFRQDESLQQMVDKLPDVDWNTGIKVWSIFSPFEHTVSPLTIEQLVGTCVL